MTQFLQRPELSPTPPSRGCSAVSDSSPLPQWAYVAAPGNEASSDSGLPVLPSVLAENGIIDQALAAAQPLSLAETQFIGELKGQLGTVRREWMCPSLKQLNQSFAGV